MNNYKTVFNNIETYQQLESVVLHSKELQRCGVIPAKIYGEVTDYAKSLLRSKYSDLIAIRNGREPMDPVFFKSYKGNERMIINLPL